MNSLMLVQKYQHFQDRNASNITNPASDEDMDCFKQFNPQTEEETQAVAENWAKAFMKLCQGLQSNALSSRTSAVPILDPVAVAPPNSVSEDPPTPSPAGMWSRLVSRHSEDVSPL